VDPKQISLLTRKVLTRAKSVGDVQDIPLATWSESQVPPGVVALLQRAAGMLQREFFSQETLGSSSTPLIETLREVFEGVVEESVSDAVFTTLQDEMLVRTSYLQALSDEHWQALKLPPGVRYISCTLDGRRASKEPPPSLNQSIMDYLSEMYALLLPRDQVRSVALAFEAVNALCLRHLDALSAEKITTLSPVPSMARALLLAGGLVECGPDVKVPPVGQRKSEVACLLRDIFGSVLAPVLLEGVQDYFAGNGVAALEDVASIPDDAVAEGPSAQSLPVIAGKAALRRLLRVRQAAGAGDGSGVVKQRRRANTVAACVFATMVGSGRSEQEADAVCKRLEDQCIVFLDDIQHLQARDWDELGVPLDVRASLAALCKSGQVAADGAGLQGGATTDSWSAVCTFINTLFGHVYSGEERDKIWGELKAACLVRWDDIAAMDEGSWQAVAIPVGVQAALAHEAKVRTKAAPAALGAAESEGDGDKSKQCERCLIPMKDDWKACPQCGPPAPAPTAAEFEDKCPRCSRGTRSQWKFCPGCRLRLVSQVSSKKKRMETDGDDPEKDARLLHDALEGWDPDCTVLIDIIGGKSNEHLQCVKVAYQRLFKKSLPDDVSSKSSFYFRDMLLCLLKCRAELICDTLWEIVHGVKSLSDEERSTLTEVVLTNLRTRKEVDKLWLDKYCKTRSLTSFVQDESSFDYRAHLGNVLSLPKLKVPVEQDVQELTEALKKMEGGDSDRICQIFAQRTQKRLKEVLLGFAEATGKSAEDLSHKNFEPALRETLLAQIRVTLDTPSFLADKLYAALTDGLNDETIVRVLSLRQHIDLNDVEKAYEAKYGTTLSSALTSKVFGDYRLILLKVLDRP